LNDRAPKIEHALARGKRQQGNDGGDEHAEWLDAVFEALFQEPDPFDFPDLKEIAPPPRSLSRYGDQRRALEQDSRFVVFQDGVTVDKVPRYRVTISPAQEWLEKVFHYLFSCEVALGFPEINERVPAPMEIGNWSSQRELLSQVSTFTSVSPAPSHPLPQSPFSLILLSRPKRVFQDYRFTITKSGQTNNGLPRWLIGLSEEALAEVAADEEGVIIHGDESEQNEYMSISCKYSVRV